MNDSQSGKFILRVSPGLHRRLKQESDRRNLSLNRFCEEKLALAVGNQSQRAPSSWSVAGLPVSILQEALKELGEAVLCVILFGSVVRGEADENSDIDLLLVLPDGTLITRELYTRWSEKVEPVLKAQVARTVSPQFVSLPASPQDVGSLWFEVAMEGVTLMENGFVVSSFIRQIREMIMKGEIVRHESCGHPYWIRKQVVS